MPSPIHGQVNLTGTAAQVDPTLIAGDVAGFTIKAPLANAAPAYIGASGVTTANGFCLDPGESVGYERLAQNGQPKYQLRPSDFYAIGTSGDRVTWLASP